MKSLTILSMCACLAGCAPAAREVLGDVARYSPADAAYVMGEGPEPVVLRDPLTGEKLRCRDELERAAPALSDALDDVVHDRRGRLVARASLAPITAVGTAGTMLGRGLLSPAMGVSALVSSPQPRTLYERASAAFAAGRFEESRSLYQSLVIGGGRGEALCCDLPRAWLDLSLYYLALSDEALHRDEEAAAAFAAFLNTATLRDEARYRDAEQRLARLRAVPACTSRADFTMAWRRAR